MTAGHEGLRASLRCNNNKEVTTAGHDGLLTMPRNYEENLSTAGREGLQASLQCDTMVTVHHQHTPRRRRLTLGRRQRRRRPQDAA
jgi:hypothetical protein